MNIKSAIEVLSGELKRELEMTKGVKTMYVGALELAIESLKRRIEMKFDKAVEQTKQELLNKYKDVVYKGYEVVKMTSNTTTSNYIREEIDIDTMKVVHIKNRFKEIEGEIKAIKVVFDVKYPRKRKYNHHEEYFRIID